MNLDIVEGPTSRSGTDEARSIARHSARVPGAKTGPRARQCEKKRLTTLAQAISLWPVKLCSNLWLLSLGALLLLRRAAVGF